MVLSALQLRWCTGSQTQTYFCGLTAWTPIQSTCSRQDRRQPMRWSGCPDPMVHTCVYTYCLYICIYAIYKYKVCLLPHAYDFHWTFVNGYVCIHTCRQTCRLTSRQIDINTHMNTCSHIYPVPIYYTHTHAHTRAHTHTHTHTLTLTHTHTHFHVDCSPDIHNLWKCAIFRFVICILIQCDVCLCSHMLKVPIPSSIWLPGRRWKENWEFGLFPVKWKRLDCVQSVANQIDSPNSSVIETCMGKYCGNCVNTVKHEPSMKWIITACVWVCENPVMQCPVGTQLILVEMSSKNSTSK